MPRIYDVWWLLFAGLAAGGGCGSRSSTLDVERYGGFGNPDGGPGTGGSGGGVSVPGACVAPACVGCVDCLSACRCTGANEAACVSACGRADGCVRPACSRCDTCFDECQCTLNDPTRCATECGLRRPPPPPPPSGGTGGGVGGAPPTGGVAGACGGVVCPSASTPVGSLNGCCLAGGECGLDLAELSSPIGLSPGCLPVSPPGARDPSCPSHMTPTGFPIPACCTPQGACGLDLGPVGLGCVDNRYVDTVPSAPCYQGYGGSYGTGGYGYGGYYETGGYGYGGYYGTGAYGYGGYPYGGGYPPYSDPIAQCIDQARTDCEVCACEACLPQVSECFGDAGCPFVLQCANQTGCSGVGCYEPETCQAVIDEYGGPSGVSIRLATPLFQCLTDAACPCGFAG